MASNKVPSKKAENHLTHSHKYHFGGGGGGGCIHGEPASLYKHWEKSSHTLIFANAYKIKLCLTICHTLCQI